VQVGHTIEHRAASIGGGKMAAIGQQRRAQPGDPALPCCLARFVDAAPPWRPAHDQENRKIRLAGSLQKSLPSLPPHFAPSHKEVQSNSRALPSGLPGPRISRGSLGCGHCVCACCSRCSAAMTLTCSMQACNRVTSVRIIYVKGSHNTLLVPEEDCKSYTSV
jgi:hypothetical protein